MLQNNYTSYRYTQNHTAHSVLLFCFGFLLNFILTYSVARTFFVKTARFWTIFRKPAHFPAHKFVQNPHILDQNVKNPHNFYLVRFYCFQGKTLKFCKKCPGQYFYFIFMPQFLNKICYFQKKKSKISTKICLEMDFLT